MTNHKTKRGECDVCGKLDIEIFPTHHGMHMCAEHRDQELAAIARQKEVVAVVDNARKQDATIELKQDIFNAVTVSFVELQGAFAADASIPVEQKDYALAKECVDRIEKLTQVIFAEEAALMEKKNQRHAWLVQTQNLAAKLRVEQRNEFKQYDVNYKPAAPKTTKPKAVKTPTKKFNKAELIEASKKYNVPMHLVQGMCISRNMKADDAAKELAGKLGLL